MKLPLVTLIPDGLAIMTSARSPATSSVPLNSDGSEDRT